MDAARVVRHYGREGLLGAIRQALRDAGKDLDRLAPDDLAAVDEFHVRGREATLELAAALRPEAGGRVLDLGCGVGGAARHLASARGCEVTGVDLTPAYVEAARELSRWVGLGDRVRFEVADVTDLPFADGAFDAAWTQHVAMNVPDKRRLYAEARRTLRAGGRLAVYDVLQGPGGPVRYPTPWAGEPGISHLVTAAEQDRLLAGAGFAIEAARDRTGEGLAFFRAAAERARAGGAPAPGPRLLLREDDGGERWRNMLRNLEEGRIEVRELVAIARA